ncbi:hypothetical protein PV783_15320 [Chitinophaga sp. CC14]|uniref:hypothetical protein n=1 Tax=Chitinophaga sp. CC14 TaxID=3029199 RepID=UPI003B798733
MLTTFAQCDNWSISAAIVNATCKDNGKITVTLTNAGSLDSLLYQLEAITAGGTNITQSTSNVLEHIRPGTYRLTVTGLCGSTPVLKTSEVTVGGSYVEPAFYLSEAGRAFGSCKSGKMRVDIQNGIRPYTVVIVSAPAGYTGPLSFTTDTSFVVIDSLPAGNYEISAGDNCGSGGVKQGRITSISFDTYDFYFNSAEIRCNQVVLPALRMYDRESEFLNSNSPISISYKIGNYPATPYYTATQDLIFYTLPEGVTIDSLYDKVIVITVKSTCGQQMTREATFFKPYPYLGVSRNCNVSGNIEYYIPYYYFCFPMYLTVQNESGQIWTKSIPSSQYASGSFTNLPFGNYTVRAFNEDSVQLSDALVRLMADTSKRLSVQIYSSAGERGNDGAIGFQLISEGDGFRKNTHVRLISPVEYATELVVPYDNYRSVFMENPAEDASRKFAMGDYVFVVDDDCGSDTLFLHVGEENVYRYDWNYTAEETCEGLRITPSGTVSVNGVVRTGMTYRVISNSPDFSYNSGNIGTGVSMVLPNGGAYKIIVGVFNPEDFSTPASGGNGRNAKTLFYAQQPLDLDPSSLGWVCPGAPANSGSIRVKAINGYSRGSAFTYKLAEEGYGNTGPYLDVNTTGSFTSNANYSLVKNKNYDIQVTDSCRRFIVRGIKILDFANFQAITTDKPLFCVGDTVYFSAVNLPTTAKTYTWTNPQGSIFSYSQNPVIYNVDSTHVGNYHVTISSDLCGAPIQGDLNLRVAPYIIKCYSAVTDTSVNPYLHGLLGNWHPVRSYTYYSARAESSPAQGTNIRKDGAFNDFLSFWQKQTKGWVPQTNNPAWVWNAESTIFNKKGFELENKDPLGRYNAAIYGYDNAVPVAVVQNSHFREAGYDGFEDYSFGNNDCADGNCPVDRHFSFAMYRNRMDTLQSHTGRYSLRVQPGDSISLAAIVSDTDRVALSPDFKMGLNNCSTDPALQSVRVNRDILLPVFSPLAGKKVVFSAWVKQAQECHCSTYTNVNVTLFVGGPNRVTVEAKPRGAIIEGWQRYEEVIEVPAGSTAFSMVIATTGGVTAYFDDIRVHPYNANMKSYAYDPVNLRLMGELDENNYATFYEYDDDGTLIRVKKETERGIKTIKESRNALLKDATE